MGKITTGTGKKKKISAILILILIFNFILNLTGCGAYMAGGAGLNPYPAAGSQNAGLNADGTENAHENAYKTTARHTEFFTPREHSDTDFSEMRYEPADMENILNQMDEVRELSGDLDHYDEVLDGFLKACDNRAWVATLDALAGIEYDLNPASENAAENRNDAIENDTVITDALYLLARDILNSPCAGVLDELEIDPDVLADYEPVTQEELDLISRMSDLEDEYWIAAAENYSVNYHGREWDEDALMNDTRLNDDEWYDIYDAISEKKNAALGEIFLRMLDLRRQESERAGYDNYADYAYENLYIRDYTPEDMREFHQAVKDYIAPVKSALDEIAWELSDADAFMKDFSGETALNLVEPYIAALSDELLESFQYMRRHKLYDIEASATKNNMGYTIDLPSYGAAFFYDSPVGGAQDLTTVVHEFGHYNDAYWTLPDWDGATKSIDIAEVHSQALELLFTEFYPDIFKNDSEAVRLNILNYILGSVVDGALYDEFQQWAYARPGVSLKELNQEYRRLCAEYGLIDPDDPHDELYDWTDISHTFTSPFYYISYAVSAAGAFSFWLEAQDNYDNAADRYLEFTALDIDYGFQDSFEAVDLESPITADYLKELAEELNQNLNLNLDF